MSQKSYKDVTSSQMKDESLDQIRKTIDKLDQTIINALGERQRIVRSVLVDKLEHSKEIRDPKREERMMESIRKKATEAGMDPIFWNSCSER